MQYTSRRFLSVKCPKNKCAQITYFFLPRHWWLWRSFGCNENRLVLSSLDYNDRLYLRDVPREEIISTWKWRLISAQVVSYENTQKIMQHMLGNFPYIFGYLLGQYVCSSPSTKKLHDLINKVWSPVKDGPAGHRCIRVPVVAGVTKTTNKRL